MITIMSIIALVSQACAATGMDTSRTLYVQGVAYAQVAPDMAEMWVSVSGEGLSEAEAYKNCQKAGDEVMKALKKSGVKPEDVRPGSISRVPQETYDEMGNPVSKPGIYYLDINVKVYDLTKLSGILDAVLKVEGAQVQKVDYNSYKLNDAVAKVMPEAMKDAKRQAEVLAAAAGMKLEAEPMYVSSSTYYPSGQSYSCGNGWCPPPGMFLEIDVYVYVTYRMTK